MLEPTRQEYFAHSESDCHWVFTVLHCYCRSDTSVRLATTACPVSSTITCKDAAKKNGNENAVDAAGTACCSSDRQYFDTATASLDNSLTPIQNRKGLKLEATRQKYSSTL